MKLKRVRILHVEDSPSDAELVREALTRSGGDQFEVTNCERLRDAEEALRVMDFDLILLDLSLPDSRGLETFHQIHAAAPELPVVVMTGYDDEALAVEAVQGGAQDYLDKSHLKWLVRAVRYAMERKRAARALEESERRYRLLAENATDMIWTTDMNLRLTYISPSVVRLRGYSAEEAMAQSLNQTVTPDSFARMASILEEELENTNGELGDLDDSRTVEMEYLRKDGSTVWAESRITFLRGADRTPVGILGVSRDIAERKKAEAALRALSLTDELTGLHNRRGFLVLAEQHLKLVRRMKKGLILAYADMDGLKQINDNFGHKEGDAALVQVATIMRMAFRESDILGRLGGDEFAVLITEDKEDSVQTILTRWEKKLAEDNERHPRPYKLAMSIGVVHWDCDNLSPLDEMMNEADRLMYEQKQKKRK
ncbi:MAG TPA: diguanylate cyclase [Acidobacteriota bacterium]|nr:diguanylate cyclase [Acidobacteriota bacterium]